MRAIDEESTMQMSKPLGAQVDSEQASTILIFVCMRGQMHKSSSAYIEQDQQLRAV